MKKILINVNLNNGGDLIEKIFNFFNNYINNSRNNFGIYLFNNKNNNSNTTISEAENTNQQKMCKLKINHLH